KKIEKLKNPKIFELHKIPCVLPAAAQVGLLRDKSSFYKSFLSLKRPLLKFKEAYFTRYLSNM
ncbi:MAG: hypothetical protein ACI9LN_001795, partial [Saprospiraceae bacterium]